jgi:GMP synthase (glutamine-hydrolysing)
MTDRVLILDFGSQVTQLIARRLREAGVYCEIHPFNVAEEKIRAFDPKAVILSGGPASVTAAGTPRAPQMVFEMGVPLLGICYGQMALCAQLGGEVESSDHQEFGRAFLEVAEPSALTEGLWRPGERHQVWMSHGDRVIRLPEGFRVIGTSEGAPFAMFADETRHFYGVMFHPEVVHTPDGARMLENFTRLAGCAGDWTMAAFRQQAVERIRAQVGGGKVICGLSGGVDSSVAAVLIHEAIGERPASSSTTACCASARPSRWSRSSAATTTSRWCTATPRASSSASSPAWRTPSGSARSSAPPSSMSSRRKRANWAAPRSSPRAPSTRT